MDVEIPPELANDPLLVEMVKDALELQDRFAAEPVYSKTGKGYLRSAGVAELKRLKQEQQRAGKSKE